MTQKSEIELEEEIGIIRDGCNECWLSKNCIISHAVDYIIERSEKDYEKMKTLISFCGDWCPHVELEEKKMAKYENKNETINGGFCKVKSVSMSIKVKMQAFYDEIDDPDNWAGKMLVLWSEGRDLPGVISGSMEIDKYAYIKRSGKYHMTAIYKFKTLAWVACGDADWKDKVIKETATRLLALPCDLKVIS